MEQDENETDKDVDNNQFCGFLNSITGKCEFSGECDLDKCPVNNKE